MKSLVDEEWLIDHFYNNKQLIYEFNQIDTINNNKIILLL